MVETNQTKCDLALQLVSNPIYKLAMFWTFFVSLLATPGLLYFIVKKILPLSFHGNLKCLLTTYFLATFLYSIILVLTFGYHFLVPFFASSSCSLIIPVPLFKWGQILSLLLMTIPMIIPVGFSIERFVAIGMAHDYERVRTGLGPLLMVVLICADVIGIYNIYRNESFTDNFVSFILIPSTAAVQLNNFFWLLLYVDIFNFLCNSVLLTMHNYMKSRYLRQQSSLSLRYEMEEIYQSSMFTLIVSSVNLLFVGWYLTAILIVRTIGQSFFNGYINYTVARAVYVAVPTQNLLIVFVGLKSLRHLNTKRSSKIRSTVDIKSTGSEGMKNYEDAIAKYWDSVHV